MPEPLVSVVVPVYNVELYLRRCLDSLIAQDYPHVELIVVNDGSPDNSGEIIAEYAERHDHIVVITQENQGLGAARNAGIARATGEFVGFVDSDDCVAPHFISRMVRLAERRRADVVMCSFYLEFPKGQRLTFPLMTVHRKMSGDKAGRKMLDLLQIPTFAWNKLYRRHLFADVGFPSIYYEDVATVARVLQRAERVAITHRPLYHYCLRRTGITGNFSQKNVNDYLHAVDIVRHFIWDEHLWHAWRRPYRRLLRQVERQMFVSITVQMRPEGRPQQRELIRMVRRRIAELRRPPVTDGGSRIVWELHPNEEP